VWIVVAIVLPTPSSDIDRGGVNRFHEIFHVWSSLTTPHMSTFTSGTNLEKQEEPNVDLSRSDFQPRPRYVKRTAGWYAERNENRLQKLTCPAFIVRNRSREAIAQLRAIVE
jgi:hypothetical protein